MLLIREVQLLTQSRRVSLIFIEMKGGHSQRRRFSLVIYMIFYYKFNSVFEYNSAFIILLGINSKRFASSSHRLVKKSHRASMAISSSQWTAVVVHWKKKQLQDQQVNVLVQHHPIGKADGVVHFPPNQLFIICPAAISHPVAI